MAQYYNPTQTQVQRAPQVDMQGFNQSAGALQGTLANIQNNEMKKRQQEALLQQQAIDNARANSLLGLKQQADARDATKLGLLQDAATMNNAQKEIQQYTNQTISSILAEPDLNKRRDLLKQASKTGGFNPDANGQKLLLGATTAPKVKAPTGTVTISKDGRYTNIPMSNLENFQKQGWQVGRNYKGNGNTTKSTKAYDKALNFTKDVTTNARLGKQLTDVAKEYNVDPKSMHLALNTAKEDQNNFLWWRDAAGALGFDTEPSKQDVLNRIPSGYVNSKGKTVSIADEEGYLKDAGVTIFKDLTTGKYVNKDIVTGKALTQNDVQQRINLLNLNKDKGTVTNTSTDSNTSTPTAVANSNSKSIPPSQLKIDAVKYINKLLDPNSKERSLLINNDINAISGMGLQRVARPVVEKSITKAEQFLDSVLKRKTIPGQGTMSTTGSKISANSAELKQEFLKKISDETATLLSKANKSPEDIIRLKEIANKFPSMKQDILKYLYK